MPVIKPLLKPVIIAISASLVSGALLFLLGTTVPSFGAPSGGKSSGAGKNGAAGYRVPSGYAVLTLDASWPDRSIRELLAEEGIGNTIGESSQWVFLDDFGELEKVPLDSYDDRVESFDLRNDGYAERLRSFFVFQGTRRLFIGLRGAGDLEGRVSAALGDIPFSLSILTPPTGPRSVVLPAILFTLAAALTLVFSGEALLSAFFLPLWAVLAGLGVPGFAVLAVLAGLSRLLREPVRDYFIGRAVRALRNGKSSRRPLGDLLSFAVHDVPPLTWILSALFLLALGGITILGALPPLTVILEFLFFLTLLALSIWAESHRGARQGHIRFRPVPISGIVRGRAEWTSPYARIMAPFTLAALVLQVLSVVFSGADAGSARAAAHPSSHDWTGWKSPLTLDAKAFAEAYREHVEFQRDFSFMPLGASSLSDKPQAYLRYSLATDGLIDEAVSDGAGPGEIVDSGELLRSFEIPPFPLEGLIDFLTNYTYTDPGIGSSPAEGLMCLLIVLGLGIPLMVRDRRGQRKLAIYMDKRIAA